MNIRAKKPVVVAPAFVGPVLDPKGRRIVQAAIVPIADAVAALMFDTLDGDAFPGRPGRLDGEIDGRPLPRPVVSTRLPLRRGGSRHILLIGRSAGSLESTTCRLTLDSVPVATLDPTWLQSPLGETIDLIDGLGLDGRRRLLRLFLTTAASLFGAGCVAGYGAAVRLVVESLGLEALSPSSVCALGAHARLLSYRLPPGASNPEIDSMIALSQDRVSRVAGFVIRGERLAQGELLHVFLPDVPGDCTVVALGPEPLLLETSTEAGVQPLAPWLSRRSEATQAWVEGLVDAQTASDAMARALLHELRHLAGPPPTLVVRHLSTTPGGLLVLADIADPDALVTAVRIETCAGVRDVKVDASTTRPNGSSSACGFLEMNPAPRTGSACSVRLVYGSGRVQTVGDVRLAAFAGNVPAGFAEIECRGPAAASLAAARLALPRRNRSSVLEPIGAPAPRPKLSLIARVGANPDVIRARAAMLFAEPGAAAVDLIYHVGATHAAAARRVLTGCHAAFGLGCRLLILPEDADAAERLRAALAAAVGPAALVFGPDVLPVAPGWLRFWRDALTRPRSAAILGGTLLDSDGAVGHAGGTVSLHNAGTPAQIERRWVGLPAGGLPNAPFAPTDLVTADCVGLNRRALQKLDAWTSHYPDPDAYLVAFADALRRDRAVVKTLLSARFMRFGAEGGVDPLGAAIDAYAVAKLFRANRPQETV